MALTGDHIRVLDILPYGPDGDPTSPIRCEYHTAALHDLPAYETLSYRWGDPEPRIPIDVGLPGTAQHVGVTRNLHAALLRLRHADRRRTIWIDQLCINQTDNVEKAAQVRLMRQIYSNCTVCNIWLDEIPADVSLAAARSVVDFVRCLGDREVEVPAYLKGEGSEEAVGELVRAFKVISCGTHPWWTRIWTVQEAQLPPCKKLVWGPLEFPWEDDLCKCMRNYQRGTHSQDAWELRERVHEMHGDLNTLLAVTADLNFPADQTPALEAVANWRSREATNARDKVFAMLGLFQPGEVDLIHTHLCNYDTPVARVYSAFMVDLILAADSLKPFMMEVQGDPALAVPDLPRWAPDLLTQNPYYATEWPYRRQIWNEFDACAGRPLDKKALLEAAAVPEWDMRVLGVSGVFVDTVEFVGAKMLWKEHTNSHGPPDSVIVETLLSWMVNARNYYLRENIDLYETQFNENFCRLLLGGLVRGWTWTIEREPNEEDLSKVAEYLRTASRDVDWWMNEDLYCQVLNQSFFVTKSGLMGIGHLDTKHGDELWVFNGGNFPFIARPKDAGSEKDYSFVGCAYVEGIMDGEVYEDEMADDLQRTIHLH